MLERVNSIIQKLWILTKTFGLKLFDKLKPYLNLETLGTILVLAPIGYLLLHCVTFLFWSPWLLISVLLGLIILSI
jgi:hypothetical protein